MERLDDVPGDLAALFVVMARLYASADWQWLGPNEDCWLEGAIIDGWSAEPRTLDQLAPLLVPASALEAERVRIDVVLDPLRDFVHRHRARVGVVSEKAARPSAHASRSGPSCLAIGQRKRTLIVQWHAESS